MLCILGWEMVDVCVCLTQNQDRASQFFTLSSLSLLSPTHKKQNKDKTKQTKT